MNTHAPRLFEPRAATVPANRNTSMTGVIEARALAGHLVSPIDPSQSPQACTVRSNAPVRMLRIAQVVALTGLSKTTIHHLQAEGDFPRRVKLTARRVGWVEAEVQAWLAARIASNVVER